MNMYKLFSNHRACMYKRIRCSLNLTAYTNKLITLFSILPARTKKSIKLFSYLHTRTKSKKQACPYLCARTKTSIKSPTTSPQLIIPLPRFPTSDFTPFPRHAIFREAFAMWILQTRYCRDKRGVYICPGIVTVTVLSNTKHQTHGTYH